MKIRKIFSIIFSLVVFLQILPGSASALVEPDLGVISGIVVDIDSGTVLFQKNANEAVYPASITKIMTVLLAVEAIEDGKASIDDMVTASDSMQFDLIDGGSTAGIMVGETMSFKDVLYCAMLSSANEACNIIAEYISGSVASFVRAMNTRASELGCVRTHFENTHGLPNDNHYTTAADMSLIIREAITHDLFMEICNTPSYTLPATNYSAERNLSNSNALICADSIYGGNYLYEYASGIKTGHTNAAGYCLASTAEKDGIRLLCAVFGGEQTVDSNGQPAYENFADTITLYDWAFENYSYREILKSTEVATEVPVAMGSDADSVNVRPERSIMLLLPNDAKLSDFRQEITIYSVENGETVTAPVSAGDVLGEVTVQKDGVTYGTVKLVAATSVELSRMEYMKSEVRRTLNSKPIKITAWVFGVLIVLYLVLVIRYRILRIREKQDMRKRTDAYYNKLKQQYEKDAGAQLPPQKNPENKNPTQTPPPPVDEFEEVIQFPVSSFSINNPGRDMRQSPNETGFSTHDLPGNSPDGLGNIQ